MKYCNREYEVTINEFSSSEDSDDLNIVGFIASNDVSKNDFYLSGQMLQSGAPTFNGRPLRILPNPLTNKPTGHGFNKETGNFSKNVINIGRIDYAWLVKVDENGQPSEEWQFDPSDNDQDLRIAFNAKMWKEYYPELAEQLILLHERGELKFSFEARVGYETNEQGIRIATSFRGTGLAIVENPAFDTATSLLVAEQDTGEGENRMDYEVEYNKINGLYETVVAEKSTLETTVSELNAKVTGLESELATANTQLATKVSEVSQKDTELAELLEVKGKFEVAQKEKLGESRKTQLKAYVETVEKTDIELAEMSELEFSKFALELASTLITAGGIRNANYSNGTQNKKDIDVIRESLK